MFSPHPIWGWKKRKPLPYPAYKETILEGEQEGKRGAKDRNYRSVFKSNCLPDPLLQNQVWRSSRLHLPYKTNFKEQPFSFSWMHAEQSQRSASEEKKAGDRLYNHPITLRSQQLPCSSINNTMNDYRAWRRRLNLKQLHTHITCTNWKVFLTFQEIGIFASE